MFSILMMMNCTLWLNNATWVLQDPQCQPSRVPRCNEHMSQLYALSFVVCVLVILNLGVGKIAYAYHKDLKLLGVHTSYADMSKLEAETL